jgi:hypothetical protein
VGLPELFDQIFATDGMFKRLYEEIVAQSFPAVYRRRMTLEQAAIGVWEWSPTIVPGLLQTEGYARALLRAGNRRAVDQEIAALVGARLARQGMLKAPAPPDLRVILCESVIKRRVGPAEVMREQLGALLRRGEAPTTRIQILPLDAEPHLLIDVPVTFLTSSTHATVVCVDAYRTASIVDDPEHVRAAVDAYDGITSEALSARDSAELIRRRLEAL